MYICLFLVIFISNEKIEGQIEGEHKIWSEMEASQVFLA